ncbi:acid protease, partial [Laetiporus sulphureus 93-53]
MTIGGQDLLIQLDTGSSDLWVSLPSGQFEFTNVTDITAQETYGIGAVTGTIVFANASLGDHFVYNQGTYFLACRLSSHTDLHNVRGILGLSFDAGSTVDVDVVEAFGANSTAGVSFLVNLFLQNPNMSHFFTTQLGRTDDPQYTMEGFFTIGDYVPGLEAVAQQPQLERFPNSSPTGNPPRWSTVMSGMTVNGEPFAFNASGVPGTPNGSVVAVLDTGFTFPPIPEEAVTFIYGSIEGAYFDNNSSLWIVPCENATQLEFQFENMSVPIHPLDLTTVVELNNQTVCVNTFRATTFPVNDQFDIILGDAFLKNVYASFNYGNWSASDPDAIPYIQLLPTTNLTAAFDEFAQVRSSMVTSAEASASMSATASIMPSAASGSSDSVLPTTSVLYSSAWSTYPASSAWASYSSASSASFTWSSAAPTASASADSNSSSTNTSASTTTDPTDPSANSTDTSASATESAADSEFT